MSIKAVAFSPDGKRVVTASSDQTARLWDGLTGQLLAVLGGHTGRVKHVLFSPNGTRVVTASDDATLRLWDAQTGELIGVLRGHGDDFSDVRRSSRPTAPAWCPAPTMARCASGT